MANGTAPTLRSGLHVVETPTCAPSGFVRATDAIGNVAALAAAGLVALTGTTWADLAVATVMSGLFLQSASPRQARRELGIAAA